MTNSIIPGEVFGTYKAIAISLNTAKNVNNNNVKSNYIVVTLKPYNKALRLPKAGDPVNDFIWQEDERELYDVLSKYKNNDPVVGGEHDGSYIVPMNMLEEIVRKGRVLLKKVIAYEEQGGPELTPEEQQMFYESRLIESTLYTDGGIMMPYKFQKGACYGNNANGQPLTTKNGAPVIKTSIDVFCVIDHATEGPNGIEYSWAPGKSPERKGSRIEQRFWQRPVDPSNVHVVQVPPTQAQATPPVSQPEAQPAQPAQQPAMQQQAPGEATPF